MNKTENTAGHLEKFRIKSMIVNCKEKREIDYAKNEDKKSDCETFSQNRIR